MSFKNIIINVLCLSILVSCVSNRDIFDDYLYSWDSDNTPGCVIAAVKDGEILYKKTYGMANLEKDVPNSANTRFNIASDSKQFTAYAVFILESRGLLSIEDDIRTYIPEIPEFDETIRIRDLIYHTNGLRESFSLQCLNGQIDWNKYGAYCEVEPLYNEDIIELVKNQKTLQAVPGKSFTYNNTGYYLLAEIVTRVSGVDFVTFTNQEIFEKLGMNSSGFVDHENLKKEDDALSYYYIPTEERYEVNNELDFTVGASRVYSTVNDLLLWLEFLNNGYHSGDEIVKRLLTPGSGNYCGGIMTGDFNGFKQYWHGGLTSSFTSQISFIPELNFLFVMLSNSEELQTHNEVSAIIDAVLDDKELKRPENSIEEVFLGREVLEHYTHEYYSEEFAVSLKFTIKDDQLYCNDVIPLTPISENSFVAHDKKTKFIFLRQKGGRPKLFLDSPGYSFKTRLINRSEGRDLNRFIGRYYNDELDVYYTILESDGHLITETPNGDIINLYHFYGRDVYGDSSFFNHVVFKKDYSGFYVSSASGGDKFDRRMRDVEFVKVVTP